MTLSLENPVRYFDGQSCLVDTIYIKSVMLLLGGNALRQAYDSNGEAVYMFHAVYGLPYILNLFFLL